jgi:DNA-binding GntR family transcriptional regulator
MPGGREVATLRSDGRLSTIRRLSTITAIRTHEGAGVSDTPTDGAGAMRATTPLVKSAPRGQQVVESLRSAIVAGRYEPGERLIETNLSEELGTSRGPVREALRQLENEGLVMSFPYRGAVVLGVSDEEVQEVLIPIRLTLERYSFVHAAERMTDADFAELGKQIWVMEQAAKAGDLEKIVEADLRFHDVVISSSGQPHTVQVWRTIFPRIRGYFLRYGRDKSLEPMVAEHRELLEALQTRDPDVMMRQLERHIAVRPPSGAKRARGGRKAAGK